MGRYEFIFIAVAVGFLNGCSKPSKLIQTVQYDERELRSLKLYREGNIIEARKSLFDYLDVLREEKASGLPFNRLEYAESLAFTRLALICQRLGETNLQKEYIERAVQFAKEDVKKYKYDSVWRGETDDEIRAALIDFVNKIEQVNTPRWRKEANQ